MQRAIPVAIVESHNEVVPFIYRLIGSKRIPSSGLKLLHFDSHPDLGVPDVPVSDLRNDSINLLRKVNIENWILPMVHAGHFNSVCWLHPIWSNQLMDRQPTHYFIGEDKKTRRLGINIPEAYFYNDGIFCCEEDMDAAVKFGLTVAPIHETNTICRVCENIICEFINQPFILDIDLDTFSTQNPFLERFNEEQFKLIDQLYAPSPPITISLSSEEFADASEVVNHGMACADVLNAARRRQLNRIRYWLNLMGNGRPITSPEVLALWPREISDLCKLVLSVRSTQPDSVRIPPAAVQALEQTLAFANKKLAEIGENLPAVALASDEDTVLKALTELGLQVNEKPALFPSDKENSSCWQGTSPASSVSDTARNPIVSKRQSGHDNSIDVSERNNSSSSVSRDTGNELMPSVLKVVLNKLTQEERDHARQRPRKRRNTSPCSSVDDDGDGMSGKEDISDDDCNGAVSGDGDGAGVMAPLDFLHYLWSGLAEEPDLPFPEETDQLMAEKQGEDEAGRNKYPTLVPSSLPHHISTAEEQEDVCGSMESLLNRLHNPGLITICRSVLDGYTPAHQVDAIQLNLLHALVRIYGRAMLTIALDYKGSKEHAKQLKSMGLNVISPSEMMCNLVRGCRGTVRKPQPEATVGAYGTEPGRKDIV